MQKPLDIWHEDFDKCRGCCREGTHKMCPAYGTKFYMSGIPFTKDMEAGFREIALIGGGDMIHIANHAFDIGKHKEPSTIERIIQWVTRKKHST